MRCYFQQLMSCILGLMKNISIATTNLFTFTAMCVWFEFFFHFFYSRPLGFRTFCRILFLISRFHFDKTMKLLALSWNKIMPKIKAQRKKQAMKRNHFKIALLTHENWTVRIKKRNFSSYSLLRFRTNKKKILRIKYTILKWWSTLKTFWIRFLFCWNFNGTGFRNAIHILISKSFGRIYMHFKSSSDFHTISFFFSFVLSIP